MNDRAGHDGVHLQPAKPRNRLLADRGQHFGVGRKRPGGLLGVSQPAIDSNFKHPATTPLQ